MIYDNLFKKWIHVSQHPVTRRGALKYIGRWGVRLGLVCFVYHQWMFYNGMNWLRRVMGLSSIARPLKYGIELGADTFRVMSLHGQEYQLNQTGKLIWSLCDGQHSPEQITHIVAQYYHCSVEECRRDVNRFIQELEATHLIQIV
ncbi:MAG: PqqD family protein [Gemmatimonadetes bacterium]|nr:MAG: PqqD family protein [Gemmatimonadota bacterium]